jgi:hypothetical protein
MESSLDKELPLLYPSHCKGLQEFQGFVGQICDLNGRMAWIHDTDLNAVIGSIADKAACGSCRIFLGETDHKTPTGTGLWS